MFSWGRFLPIYSHTKSGSFLWCKYPYIGGYLQNNDFIMLRAHTYIRAKNHLELEAGKELIKKENLHEQKFRKKLQIPSQWT